MRSCGILMHITSLPSPYGIGTFGAEAERFADWLRSAGQKYWQVLPIGPTGYGDSPYQPFSSFAGDPLLIDLDELAENGYLARSSVTEADYGADPTFVDYDKIRGVKMALLKEAFAGFTDDVGYTSFVMDEGDWLDDYALFAALKERFGNRPWTEWEESIKLRKPEAVKQYTDELQNEIKFHKFVQYIFWRQWDRFHRYCNKNGIQVIGDIPIYVSPDCADVWAHPELFELDERLNPRRVAGVPPDLFSSTGQLWGNPLYRWDYHRETGYSWWISRLHYVFQMYDVVRIDHFRGFDEYFSIPYGAENAIGGHWEKGPGIDLFRKVEQALGWKQVIAEDLGYVTDSVRELVRESGFPGMKVLEFAFDSRDSGCANDYLPHNYPVNSVAYTGTHDNETIVGWWSSITKEEQKLARDYMCDQYTPERELYKSLISLIMRSSAKLCVIPMQDYLGLGNNCRINTPSTVGKNWKWRVNTRQLSLKLQKKIQEMTLRYGRMNWKTVE